ncbi:DUF3501 family protein [Ferrimonas gelatinilytica]|uniref:DUF3501 family protein n=1 Tax=Ferrimonas gelatinilytica TaxID=1255257 RepID=A0ABP9RUV4_9GAMM
MKKLQRDDLLSLESYAAQRDGFRARVMGHKQSLQLSLGPHLRLLFEDRLTIQYQVQEMLRIEKLFEAEEIQQELDAYNPLIPDGDNWKATMMLEYPDIDERREALSQLVGIEEQVMLHVGDEPAVAPVADEDMDRSEPGKTSSVHFLRWQLSDEMRQALSEGAPVWFSCEHPALAARTEPLGEPTRSALIQTLDPLRPH